MLSLPPCILVLILFLPEPYIEQAGVMRRAWRHALRDNSRRCSEGSQKTGRGEGMECGLCWRRRGAACPAGTAREIKWTLKWPCCAVVFFQMQRKGREMTSPLLMLATSAKVLSRGGKKGAGYSIAGGLLKKSFLLAAYL